MTPKQFQAALDRLGLTQVGAAKLFGSNPRTARRWASGELSVPAPVAIILQLLIAGKITLADVQGLPR